MDTYLGAAVFNLLINLPVDNDEETLGESTHNVGRQLYRAGQVCRYVKSFYAMLRTNAYTAALP